MNGPSFFNPNRYPVLDKKKKRYNKQSPQRPFKKSIHIKFTISKRDKASHKSFIFTRKIRFISITFKGKYGTVARIPLKIITFLNFLPKVHVGLSLSSQRNLFVQLKMTEKCTHMRNRAQHASIKINTSNMFRTIA